MTKNGNPVIILTPEQTAELRKIWDVQRQKLNPDDYQFIRVKLSRSEAMFTQKQAFRMMMTLAETDYVPIPEWLIRLFDPKPQRGAR